MNVIKCHRSSGLEVSHGAKGVLAQIESVDLGRSHGTKGLWRKPQLRVVYYTEDVGVNPS